MKDRDVNGPFYVEIVTDEIMGESIELLEDVADDKLTLTVSSRYSGDSESGFGGDTTTQMSRAHATQLREAIDRWLNK